MKLKVWFHNCYNDDNYFLCFLCMISTRWTCSCFWSSYFTNDCYITVYNDTKRHKITQQNFWSQKPSRLAVCKTPHTILNNLWLLLSYGPYDIVEILTNCWFEASLPPIWQRVRNLKAGTDRKEANTQVNKATSREYYPVIIFCWAYFKWYSKIALWLVDLVNRERQ